MLSSTKQSLRYCSARLPNSRSFTSGLICQAKAAKPTAPAKSKGGGFKVKKEEYSGNKKIAAAKVGPLPAHFLAGHHLLQPPQRELKLPQLAPDVLTSRAVGTAVSLPSGPGSITGTFGLPISLESEFLHLSNPTSVIRDTTLTVINALDGGYKSGTSNKDARIALTGATGSGKSHLLLQAANYAAASKWIVLYVPRVISWVDSTTPYAYDPRTKTFQQPELAAQVLGQFISANSGILLAPSTKITKDIQNERLGSFSQGDPLSVLLNIGQKDQSLATEVLSVTLEILGEQAEYVGIPSSTTNVLRNKNRHPVLLAIDDFQALFCMSRYRDPQYQLIYSHHLSLPRLILEYASGKRILAKGAVVGALSSTDARFLAPLPLKEALGVVEPGSVSPYEHRNKDVAFYASGVQGLSVPYKMQLSEAASMFDIWVKNNVLHTPAKDSLFLSKWYELKTCGEMLKELGADIVCFQEMKISRQLLTRSLAVPENYNAVMSFPKSKGGYSGVAVYTNNTRVVPLKAEEGLLGGYQSTSKIQMDVQEHISKAYPESGLLELMSEEEGGIPTELIDLDSEGRSLVVDFGLFVLINVYCPNLTSEERMPFKYNFHKVLEDRVRILIQEGREVIVLGDLNVVAAPIDHCEGNLDSRKNAFWESPVRTWFRQWLDPEGPMVDAIRSSWPNREKMFTCWDTRTNARESNYGTRIDYILITKGLLPWFKHGDIQPDIRGSDHCPIFIDLHDEITSSDGEVLHLADFLGLASVSGQQRDPPPISTKFWDEFSDKQKLLSAFFSKKSSPSISKPSTQTSEHNLQKIESGAEIRNDESPSAGSVSGCSTQVPLLAAGQTESGKPVGINGRKREATSSRLETGDTSPKKPKKSQTTGTVSNQHKLSNFFTNSFQPKSSAKRFSSPPIEVSDSEDEARSPKPKSGFVLSGSNLESNSQVKSTESAKHKWSQLMRPVEPPRCIVHDAPTKEFTVNKAGPNKGKKFFICSMPMGPGYDSGKSKRLREEVDPRYRCNYFKWASDVKRETKLNG
ncbi:DNA-(apurinic or apyrimidinic site) lyase, partial [Rhizoctonia solani]